MGLYLGIDPGATGALAFFDPDFGFLEIIDMPIVDVRRNNKNRKEIAPQMLAALIKPRSPRRALIERVGARPGEAPSFAYQFGRGVGMIEGVLAALNVPVDYIAPQVWQKQVNMRAGKDGSRERAAQLFPAYAGCFARVKDDGRSDAALIAWVTAQSC